MASSRQAVLLCLAGAAAQLTALGCRLCKFGPIRDPALDTLSGVELQQQLPAVSSAALLPPSHRTGTSLEKRIALSATKTSRSQSSDSCWDVFSFYKVPPEKRKQL